MDDDEDIVEVEISTDAFDAADFFLAALQHDLPDYVFNPELVIVKRWRPTWIITVSEQFHTSLLEEVAFTWQQKIYFETGWLIGYSIQKEDELEQEQGNSENH